MAARKTQAELATQAGASAAGSWNLVCAVLISGKGISFAGGAGFCPAVIKPDGMTQLDRDDVAQMLVVTRTGDGKILRLEIPLSAVALESVWVVDG